MIATSIQKNFTSFNLPIGTTAITSSVPPFREGVQILCLIQIEHLIWICERKSIAAWLQDLDDRHSVHPVGQISRLAELDAFFEHDEQRHAVGETELVEFGNRSGFLALRAVREIPVLTPHETLKIV